MMDLTGVVIAGGRSTRMGSDKALLEFAGRRLVERAVSVLARLCDNVLLSTNNPALAYLGCPLVQDEHRGIGPIAGLHAAMRYCRTSRCLVIPCDTPLVTVDVFERLFAISRETHPPAVVAGTEDGLVEPLIGCYHRSTLSVLEEQISRKEYSVHEALSRIGAEVEVFADGGLFLNINTRSDIPVVKDALIGELGRCAQPPATVP